MIDRMSIAVSILVKPSKLLRLMVCAIAVCTVFFAILIGMDQIGYFPLLSRMVMVGVSVLIILGCLFYVFHSIKTYPYRIDISNAGQIRFTSYPLLSGNNGEIVSMMDGSILWSGLLLLYLQSDTGRKYVLHVLPDSVSEDSFRMLLVACRWIAAHRHESI